MPRGVRLPVLMLALVALGGSVTLHVLGWDLTARRLVEEGLKLIDPRDAAYFPGAEALAVTDRPGMARWREPLFAALSRNATPAGRYFGLPPDRTVILAQRVEL